MGRASLTPDQIAALICREFGWTWEEYQNAPHSFIQVVLSMLREEADEVTRRSKK